MPGFGYKTSWLAVRDRSPEDVADALELDDRTELSWPDGTDRAYEYGVYVAVAPVPGWTLAHSSTQLPAGFDATEDRFPGWLERLSLRLGEVQFFATDRVSEFHAWALAQNGQLQRAYCYLGERDEVLYAAEPGERCHRQRGKRRCVVPRRVTRKRGAWKSGPVAWSPLCQWNGHCSARKPIWPTAIRRWPADG